MHYAVIDIETRIDKTLVKAIYGPDDATDEEEAYTKAQKSLFEKSGGKGAFFPVPFHIPVSIVVGQVNDKHALINVSVLGEEANDYSPEHITNLFWSRMDRFGGEIVTFNGRGFDLPVLELQALKYGISAPRFFNNNLGYRSRFSYTGHFDLMDFITNYNSFHIKGGLNVLCRIIGLPGKESVRGEDVQGLWEKGLYDEIHKYCRKDVIQTYFLFLRIELLRGKLDKAGYENAFHMSEGFLEELIGKK